MFQTIGDARANRNHGRHRLLDLTANRHVFVRDWTAVYGVGDVDDRLDVIDDGPDGQRDAPPAESAAR